MNTSANASSEEYVLSVDGLCVGAQERRAGHVSILQDISFSIAPGKVTALIGESGSGKTTIALACLGYSRAGCNITAGRVQLGKQDILSLTTSERRKLRGREVAYIAQSAAAAFNSALRINRQVTEPAVQNKLLSQQDAERKAQVLYRELDLPDPENIGERYPHQVSGGQLQRLMAAMAMICDPRLLIMDEPTTALDVTTQIEVLRSFKKLIKNKNTSAIYVSHDLAVVAQIADDVLVLKGGVIVERGSVQSIIDHPQHPYTRELIGAAHVMPETLPPSRSLVTESDPALPLLQVSSVTVGYGRRHEFLALENVSISLHAGRTLGVIGESGSGKTTLGRVISGLMPPKLGQVNLLGKILNDDLGRRDRKELQHIQFAFQMADVALNPKHRISKILGRPLQFYFNLDAAATQKRVAELLELVELPPEYANRYPRQLSGGEKQRVNLARALAAEPQLIICDEITSALDTVVAKAILALLKDLQTKLNIAYLFISHDLSTIANVADTIAVMRNGEVLEIGTTSEIMTPPYHPYTELLLNSVPEMRTDWLDGR
ncbi:MAG: peptide/nickel transport system ATP-binding protein [Porticoccaceae bacterium]|jgi:peptide/nickel transport system ATP-binding protein